MNRCLVAVAVGSALLLVDEPEGGMDAEGIRLWHEVITRAMTDGQPAMAVAAHRPVALDGLPVRTITLRAAGGEAVAPFVARVEESQSRSVT